MLLLDYHVGLKLIFHYLIIMLYIYEWNLIFIGCLVCGISGRGLWSFWSRINRGVVGSLTGGLVLGLGLGGAGSVGLGLSLLAIIIIFLITWYLDKCL